MKQGGFHGNQTSIAHFSRSLFGNLVANSDQLFLPIDQKLESRPSRQCWKG